MALISAIVLLRIGMSMSANAENTFLAKWRPVLLEALSVGEPGDLPVLHSRDCMSFLRLWNYLQESLRGSANDTLNEMARRLQCDRLARRLLEAGTRAHRLTAILTLGHLRDWESWAPLQLQAATTDSVASIYAARALLKIDPMRATEQLIVLMLTRHDWSVPQLARFLTEAQDAFAVRLSENLLQIDEQHWPRALELTHALNLQLPHESLRFVMANCKTVEALVAALHLATSPQLLPTVSGYASHASWQVRIEVARFLGNVGGPAELPLLQRLLHDRNWWVRYHAARSLVDMPAVGLNELNKLRAITRGSLAFDMLDHVLAERNGIASSMKAIGA